MLINYVWLQIFPYGSLVKLLMSPRCLNYSEQKYKQLNSTYTNLFMALESYYEQTFSMYLSFMRTLLFK